MRTDTAAAGHGSEPLGRRFVVLTGVVLVAVVALSAVIALAGRWAGHTIAMAGHTDDTTPRQVQIADALLAVPSNAIRFERARRDGPAERLDLYLRWPDMEGYTDARRDDFNHADGNEPAILFLGFEEQAMSRDMSGRYEPIYAAMLRGPAQEAGGGVTLHALDPQSGYREERIAVVPRAGRTPFVARCLSGPVAADSLAGCERDLHVGANLSLTYRFPERLLPEWEALEAAVLAKAGDYLGRPATSE